jgi:integrase
MGRARKAPGNFERRAAGYYWRVYMGKQYHREMIYTVERGDAEQYARTKYEELERQHRRTTDGVLVGQRMSDLLTYYETACLPRLAPGTQGAYRDSLKPIRRYYVDVLGDPKLDRVRPVHISDYLDHRRTHRLDGAQPLHNRTLAKDRTVLHAIFAVACEREWCPGNPVTKGTKVPKGDEREPIILTDEQVDALLAACRDPQVRFYALVLGETGARNETEALWTRWEDFDFKKGFLRIVTGRNGHRVKGGRSRFVPMTSRLHQAAQAYFAAYRFAGYSGTRPEYVFHHPENRRHYRAAERVHSYRGAMDTAATKAQLPDGWHMHDLRHRRVTTWLAAGKSPVHVMQAMGHRDLRTTMGYYRFLPDHLRALVEPTATAGHMEGMASAR